MKLWRKLFILVLVLPGLFFVVLGAPAEENRQVPADKPLIVRDLPEFRITRGEVLYRRYCTFCHGDSGAGDGLNAYSIPVKPRNFTDGSLMAAKTDDDLEKVITAGGTSRGLSKYMPPFDNTLSSRRIRDLVHFIRSLALADGNSD